MKLNKKAIKTLAVRPRSGIIAIVLLAVICLFKLPAEAQTSISGIVNSYAPVTAIANTGIATTCNAATAYTTFTVGTVTGNGGAFAAGDTVMVIQMQGATGTTTDNSAFGSVSAYNQAGQYEITSVISATTTSIRTLRTVNTYSAGNGVQLVKVRSYRNANVSASLTALAWNGTTGGVLAVYVTGTLTMNANIDVSGLGFRGGASVNMNNTTCATSNTSNYVYDNTSTTGANKGEGIIAANNTYLRGRGAWANGGGGGNVFNAGGGGGSNVVAGGLGGYQRANCTNNTFSQGVGGYALTSSSSRMFMGGGGGSGFGNGSSNKVGANGGGIVFINAQTIVRNAGSILANGNTAANIPNSSTDGAGGGGGGGTIFLNVNSYTNNLIVQASGGKGGNARSNNNNNNNLYGPGGGGSGGLIRADSGLPGNVTATLTGGLNGTAGSTPQARGAAAGSNGVLETNGITSQTTCPLGLVLSGTVYNDANGASDNLINGTPTNQIGSNTLYANLINASTSLVTASVAVAANGTYSFNVPNAPLTYRLTVTNTKGVIGQASPAVALTGAVNAAEGTAANGDGTANGTTEVTTSTANVNGINFGITRQFLAITSSTASQTNPDGTGTVVIPSSNFTSNDPAVTTSVYFGYFPANVSAFTIGATTYTFNTWPGSGVTALLNAGFAIDPADGSFTIDLPYSAVDNNGERSLNTAFVYMPFTGTTFSTDCSSDPTSGTSNVSGAADILNSYYPGLGSPAINTSTVLVGQRDARGATTSDLAPGDLVVIMQMQGADLNSTNTDAYGNGTSGGDAAGYLSANLTAGYYEYNTVGEVEVIGSNTSITFAYPLSNSYFTRAYSASAGAQKFQIIRVPRHFDLSIASGATVTAPAWNGSTGGVVILNAVNQISLNGSVDVTAKGFRGGGGKQFTGATSGNTNGTTTLSNTDYRWNSPMTTAANTTGGAKGEGIAGTPAYVLAAGATTVTTNTGIEGYVNGSMGRGAPANAGGGGTDGSPVGTPSENQYNTGGGGGGNGGSGGLGGSGWHGNAVAPLNETKYPYGGHGGSVFSQTALSRLILGGGGGAGTANNSTPANEFRASGGAGGGIIIIRAKTYSGNGSVMADGGNAPGLSVSDSTQTDAAGGGGAGGTIIIATTQDEAAGLNWISASAKGGNGGNAVNHFDHGPGGGGGGGVIYHNGSLASAIVSGGANGLTRATSATGSLNNSYGALPGNAGVVQALGTTILEAPADKITVPCSTLPITLTSFYGKKKQGSVQLNWETANAINFQEFEVEYSATGRSFEKIGVQTFRNGINAYQFTHNPGQSTVVYYRLRLVDLDGSFEYSKVLNFDMRKASDNMKPVVYPNPTSEDASLIIEAGMAEEMNIVIYDGLGKVAGNNKVAVKAGHNIIPVQTKNLPMGFYLIKISGKTEQTTLKLQKLK